MNSLVNEVVKPIPWSEGKSASRVSIHTGAMTLIGPYVGKTQDLTFQSLFQWFTLLGPA
ncbi:MAG: hypothetical protein ACRESZ_22515 [Methylococcales bacterium]